MNKIIVNVDLSFHNTVKAHEKTSNKSFHCNNRLCENHDCAAGIQPENKKACSEEVRYNLGAIKTRLECPYGDKYFTNSVTGELYSLGSSCQRSHIGCHSCKSAFQKQQQNI